MTETYYLRISIQSVLFFFFFSYVASLNATRDAEFYLDSKDSEHRTFRRTNISELPSCYDFSLTFKLESDREFNSSVDTTFPGTDLILIYNDFNCSRIFDLNEKPLANIIVVIQNPSKFDFSSVYLSNVITYTWKEKIASLFQTKILRILNNPVKNLKCTCE